MHKLNKFFRVVDSAAYPFTSRLNVLSKTLSSSCGQDDDGNDDDGNDGDSGYCPCCNCPCGDSCAANMYDCRKYSAALPGNTRSQCHFEILPNIPADVFRCTDGECLGPQGQASKCGCYRNPEYFSFHHMSFYDMHAALRLYRLKTVIQTGRKPP